MVDVDCGISHVLPAKRNHKYPSNQTVAVQSIAENVLIKLDNLLKITEQTKPVIPSSQEEPHIKPEEEKSVKKMVFAIGSISGSSLTLIISLLLLL